jgi:hypothetical protein
VSRPAAAANALPLTGPVFHELLDEMRRLESHVLDSANLVGDEQSRCEAYKWIFSITQVAFDCFVWGDSARPRFVDIVGPYKKWGGDNADAYYQFAPLDPARTYRITGRRGDAVYLSITVYGGPDDGHYSTRIIGTVNDRDLTFDADGRFECWLSPHAPVGPGVQLDADAVCAITRDYLDDAAVGRRAEFRIEAVDPVPPYRQTDADLARRLRCALTWLQDQAAIVPIGLGQPNHVDPPYPVPSQTFGWAAGDASYAMGAYQLADGEALVLRGRSPECAFWNVCLWNTLLHTYNYDGERVTLNGAQCVYHDDGSWTVVIADRDPGHPNWISTQGHPAGRIWFRWFYPSETPGEISAEVVTIDALRGGR